jgi:flagellar hook assembly protein FlgD
MMNNSSTVYLGFKVVSDLKPRFTVDVTESPARESTTFVITHDRPGQDAGVSVQVADMNGTIQWTHSVTDTSNNGVTLIQWNLHGNSGHRMQPGLYLIRATVGSGGGSSQASCKLVIVGP